MASKLRIVYIFKWFEEKQIQEEYATEAICSHKTYLLSGPLHKVC